MADTENSGSNNPKSGDDDSESENSLDSILVRIGQFGKYQLINYLLICIPMAFNAVASLTYVFTADTVTHRCNITECDTPTSDYYEDWINFTIPMSGSETLQSCDRFVFISNETVIFDRQNDSCYEYNYYQGVTENCGKDFKFRDKELTISNDFGIFCSDEWQLSMVGEVNNIGQLFGIPIGGYLSDSVRLIVPCFLIIINSFLRHKYGRRNALACGGLISAILGLMRSFAFNYYWFLIFEFLESVANSSLYATVFVIGIELVGPKRRNIACSVISLFYPLGEALLGLVAKYSQNWRILLRILYGPALVHILYFWILPESVRWLLSQGEEEKAADILRKAAATNKRKLSDSHLDKLILENRKKLKLANENKFPIRQAFRSLFWRIANSSLLWFSSTLIFYGLSLNINSLDGNKYNNFIYVSLIEMPGLVIAFLIMDRMGRRYSLFACMLVCGICGVASIFIPTHQSIWNLVLYLISKLAITGGFTILYLLTSELFPTAVRNSMLSFCSMIGRFGSMLAALTPLLGKYYANGPMTLFSSFAIISACTALLLPETANVTLPATTKEADEIGDKKFSDIETTHL